MLVRALVSVIGTLLLIGLLSEKATASLPVVTGDPEVSVGPQPTDLDGNAGGATVSPEVDHARARKTVKARNQRRIVEWERRIASLQASADNRREDLARQLASMKEQAKQDVKELDDTTGRAWLDLTAALEARFRRMEKDYRQAMAE